MPVLRSIVRTLTSNGAAVFLVVAVLFGAIAFTRPPAFSPDTKVTYLPLAEALQKGRASEVYLTTGKAVWTIITVPALLALLRTIAPESWPSIMVGINVVCDALAAVILIGLVRLTTRSALACVAALLLYISAYDIVAWLHFILTDMIYGVLALATFAVTVGGIMSGGARSVRRRLLLFVLLLAAFITRPAGVILIPLVVIAEILARNRRHRWLWITIAAGAVAVFILRAYFYDDVRRWPTNFMRPKLEEYADREKRGEVVWDRMETFRPPPRSVGDHLIIEVDRFVRFFQFTSSNYSRTHNLANIAYFVPLYGLVIVGAVSGLRSTDGRRRVVTQVTILWIGASAWFHAITILDFDWRYRLPLVPQLILLAAFGVEALFGRWVWYRTFAIEEPAAA